MASINVTLKPHVGIQKTRLGDVPVEHNQYRVMAAAPDSKPVQVGYVGKQQGEPINFLRQPNGQPWPEPIKQAVRDQVAAQLGHGPRRESQPPEFVPTVDDDEDDLD